ncbi:MAG TPA: AAA family ATPase, partial [Thermoanaerobaculia bacterium]
MALTSLVGRASAIAELRTLISSQRLVTLTGVGGSGKTRVAAEVALRTDAKEVVWIDLAGCADPALVPNEIAAALSMRGPRFGDLPDAIAEAARDRDLLMIFDNCEHLVDACATLARSLLVRCPLLRILATSREPLAIPGERVWPLPPIAVDDAVRLFADRASAIEPGFVLTDDNRTPIAEVCRRLDLIPLAIELAAARIRVLTPGQIASRIEDRFEVLTGARGGDPRHRTLRAAIDWSYALLSAEEQRLLARLSVFAGSFTLEAAEEACDATLDAMTGLVDKSLVVVSQHRATARYHLLETIRDYASERLVAAGEVDHVRRRHALAYLTIMRETPIDPMHSIMTRLEALDAEHDNVRAALAWTLEHEPDAIALPITAAFRWYWYYRIQWSEGLQWTSRALDRSSPARSRERAATLSAAGTFAGYTGNVGDARLWLEEAESLWRVLGDERELALTLSALA